MWAVSLIYFPGCPNVGEARAQLLRAFAAAGLTPRWTEYEAGDPELPPGARGLGSPTILVDGRDVAGAGPAGSPEACRLYRDVNGARTGVPSLALLVESLKAASRPAEPRPWRSSLGSLAALAVALLPNLACPACWPAYAALLGALGLSVLLDTAWLLPLTAVFLVVALGALAYRCRERRDLGPFLLGLAAAGVILTGKFALQSPAALYIGAALLVGASAWNAWPRRYPGAACPACVPSAAATSTPGGANEKEVTA